MVELEYVYTQGKLKLQPFFLTRMGKYYEICRQIKKVSSYFAFEMLKINNVRHTDIKDITNF